MAYKALQKYAKANNGQFPSDVEQLKPYIDPPVDEAIFQRWQVVPAKSLPKYLAEIGGDWLITQKAPVDKEYEGRYAIGLAGFRSLGSEGRWDPLP